MLDKLIKFIEYRFSDSLHDRLNRYIVSHNPKSISDIERLTEEFERRSFLQENAKL